MTPQEASGCSPQHAVGFGAYELCCTIPYAASGECDGLKWKHVPVAVLLLTSRGECGSPVTIWRLPEFVHNRLRLSLLERSPQQTSGPVSPKAPPQMRILHPLMCQRDVPLN